MRPFFDRSLLVSVALLAMSAAALSADRPLPASGRDFRAATWGMTVAEVRRGEPAAPSVSEGPLLAFPATVNDQPCQVIYLFQADRLCMGFYLWSNVHDDLAAYFGDAENLRDQLATSFDEPQIEKWDWEDPMFQDDPAMRAEALGLGLVRYELGWMTGRSIVAARMSGGNLQGDILLMYADRTCFPSGQAAFRTFFADRIGLPSPYFR